MMSPPGTMARVYDALKARVMAGDFAPGERIDPGRLSLELAASATPIRDSLHRLAGERLVESWQQEGFRQPFITESSIRDLYGWSEDVVRVLLRAVERGTDEIIPVDIAASDPPLGANMLFGWLASLSRNQEHRQAMQSLIERSHVLRLAENRLIPAITDDVAAVPSLVAERRWPDVRRWNSHYHTVRLRRLAEIAEQLQHR